MKLHKIFGLAMLMLAAMTTFVSCSKDDDEQPKEKTIEMIIKHELAGTYDCQSEMFMGPNSMGIQQKQYTITAKDKGCSFDFADYRSGMDHRLVSGLGVKEVEVTKTGKDTYSLNGAEQTTYYYKGEGDAKEEKEATMSCKGTIENGELNIVVYFQPGRAPHKFKYIIKGTKAKK